MLKRVVWVAIASVVVGCGSAEGTSVERQSSPLAPSPLLDESADDDVALTETPATETPATETPATETPSDGDDEPGPEDPASREPAPLQPAECIPAGAFGCGPTAPAAMCTPVRFAIGEHDVTLTLEETDAYAFTTANGSGIIDTRRCTELAASRAARLEVESSGGSVLHFDEASTCEVIGVCKNR